MRTKLDYTEPELQRNEKDNVIDRRDAEYKQKMKQHREGGKFRAARTLCASREAKEEQVE